MGSLIKNLLAILLALTSTYTLATDACKTAENLANKEEGILSPSSQIFVVTGKKRAYIFSAPDLECKLKNQTFLIPGDKVQAYTKFNNFISIIYFRKNGTTVEGWIEESRLEATAERSSP